MIWTIGCNEEVRSRALWGAAPLPSNNRLLSPTVIISADKNTASLKYQRTYGANNYPLKLLSVKSTWQHCINYIKSTEYSTSHGDRFSA